MSTKTEGPGAEIMVAEVGETNELVRLALENRMPVEVLERLVALQERVTDRTARSEFFDALNRVQEELPEIQKTKTAKILTKGGSQYEYNYAPLDGIVRVVRPVLHKNGFSFTWTTEGADNGVLNVVCVLRHVCGHEERSEFPVPIDTKAAMSEAQKHGAALTYGQRQSLVSVLGLTTTDDTDAALGSPSYITQDQCADLEALISEVGADEEKFCEWLGVAHIPAILQRDYQRAVAALERKRK